MSLEQELKINVRPLSWYINIGAKFKGVYNIFEQGLDLFTPSKQTISERVEIEDVNSPLVDELIGHSDAVKLREDLELIDGVYPEFNVEEYLNGEVGSCIFWLSFKHLWCKGIT